EAKAHQEPQESSLSLFDAFEQEEEPEIDNSRKCHIMLLLGKALEEKMGSDMLGLYTKIEAPLIGVLSQMEKDGVRVDMSSLKDFADSLRKEMNSLGAKIREEADEPTFNILSPKQVGNILFDKLRIAPQIRPKRGSNAYPTDEETLRGVMDRHPIVGHILEFRGLTKLLSTYIEPFGQYVLGDGKIHTTFNQGLTATGRLSSSKPNLQNIPIRTERGKEIRKAFTYSRPDGVIVAADYSQIELRILAHFCGDEHLVAAFREGIDIHKATAARIFGIPTDEVTPDQRRVAKTANFGIIYGISSFGLSQQLDISRDEAQTIINDYFASFPAIRSFLDDTLTSARENGYVETLFGRRRYIPDINSRNGNTRAFAERNAIN
ncbi:MAG: DNA polymerase, partial [Bacteroidales bacterium]|nr:DNA polymerase [Bacteroidales bacterium]